MQTPARKPRLPGPADPRRPAGPTPRPRGAPRHPRPPTPRRRPRSGPRTSRRARAPRREREAGRPTRCGGAVSGASPLRPWRSTSRPFATRTAIWSAATRSTGARDAWKGEPGLGKCLQQSTNRQVSGALEPSSPGAVQSLAVCSWIQEEESHGEQVFKIEVLMNGRKHFVEKRYSEFHALHKKLKKCIKTPEIPSKHVRNWVPKVLEQRRQGLETYLQAVILENEELPKLFLDFLNVRHLPSLPKAESCGSFDETESEESSKLSHQPVLLFLGDPYVLPAASDFPNVVIEGVLHGIFFSHLQPR